MQKEGGYKIETFILLYVNLKILKKLKYNAFKKITITYKKFDKKWDFKITRTRELLILTQII